MGASMKRANVIGRVFSTAFFCLVFLSVGVGNSDAGKDAPSIESRVSTLEAKVNSMQNTITNLNNTLADLQTQLNNAQLAILGLEQTRAGFNETAAGMSRVYLTGAYEDIISVTLNAPSNGYVILIGSGFFLTDHQYGSLSMGRISLSNTQNGGVNNGSFTSSTYPSTAPTGGYDTPFSLTKTFNVVPGRNTFYMNGSAIGNISVMLHNLTAIFVPYKY